MEENLDLVKELLNAKVEEDEEFWKHARITDKKVNNPAKMGIVLRTYFKVFYFMICLNLNILNLFSKHLINLNAPYADPFWQLPYIFDKEGKEYKSGDGLSKYDKTSFIFPGFDKLPSTDIEKHLISAEEDEIKVELPQTISDETLQKLNNASNIQAEIFHERADTLKRVISIIEKAPSKKKVSKPKKKRAKNKLRGKK